MTKLEVVVKFWMVLDQAPNGRFRGGQVLISPNQVRVITQIRSQVHVPNQVHINPLLCQVLLIIPFGYNTILKHLFTFYYFDHFMQNFQLDWNSLLWFIIISHFFSPFQSYFLPTISPFSFYFLFPSNYIPPMQQNSSWNNSHFLNSMIVCVKLLLFHLTLISHATICR